jgi:hypothetical protein
MGGVRRQGGLPHDLERPCGGRGVSQSQSGQFTDGRGEFYGQDSVDGRMIYVRWIWSNTTSPAPHFEQAYSADGGRNWEVNWITEQTRIEDAPAKSR